MKTAHDALRFLVEEGLCHPDDLVWGHDAPLTSAAPDAEARAGDVAWMSSKGLTRAPERLASFCGTLLVLPREAEREAVPEGVNAARCSKPKLAFSKVVTALFDRRSQPGWPVAAPAYPEGTTFGEGVVLAPGVVLGEGVRLGDRVRIGPNTCLAHCIVGNDVEIGANCSIGLAGYGYDRDDDGVLFRFPHLGNVIIEDEVSIGSNTCIDRGALGSTIIGRGCKIDNLVHVAHNVVVKPGALLIAHAMIGGSTTIGERAWIAPTAALLNQIEVGHDAVVGMGAVVVKTVAPGAVVVGNPARPLPPRTP